MPFLETRVDIGLWIILCISIQEEAIITDLRKARKMLRTNGNIFQKIIKTFDFSFHEEIYIVRTMKMLQFIHLMCCWLKFETFLFNYLTG